MSRAALRRIMAARTGLVLDEPFFGTLALRLKIQEDPGCGTAWTDGTSLGYDPTFIESLTKAETAALVAHEVMHCALGHPWRRSGREAGRWNIACDRTINPTLREAGFKLPEGALYELEPSHLGKSAEWIYDRLPQSQDQSRQKPGADGGSEEEGGPGGRAQAGKDDGQTGNTPDPLGEVRDAPKESDGPEGDEAEAGESEWQQAVQQAATVAKAQGKLPGSLERLAKQAAESRLDWKTVLRRFIQQTARSDYIWQRPSTRYLASGLYLPSLRSEETPPLAVAVDTSGSIDQTALAQFGTELQAIADEMQPHQLHVLYCDTKVHRTETFERGDPVELKAKGGGGTDFRPVFEELEKLDTTPACLIYLTDLMGRFPEQAPEIPTLWVSTGRARIAPFGETVPMD